MQLSPGHQDRKASLQGGEGGGGRCFYFPRNRGYPYTLASCLKLGPVSRTEATGLQTQGNSSMKMNS